jgi:hypothetical protein
MNADERIKVWIVDGEAFLRAGLRALLHAQSGRRLAHQAALRKAARRIRLGRVEDRPRLAVVRRAGTAPDGEPPDAA